MNDNYRKAKVATGADWIIPVIGAFATCYLISIKDLDWVAKVGGVFALWCCSY